MKPVYWTSKVKTLIWINLKKTWTSKMKRPDVVYLRSSVLNFFMGPACHIPHWCLNRKLVYDDDNVGTSTLDMHEPNDTPGELHACSNQAKGLLGSSQIQVNWNKSTSFHSNLGEKTYSGWESDRLRSPRWLIYHADAPGARNARLSGAWLVSLRVSSTLVLSPHQRYVPRTVCFGVSVGIMHH